MGSLVSVVVAEIVMQNIEERTFATYKQTVQLRLRYVDDTFTAVHKNEIDDFHESDKTPTNSSIILQPYFSQSND